MPMQYDPKTGVPRYVPDLGEELEEGVTPPVAKITYGNKTDPFKGDKPLTADEYETLKNFDALVDTTVADMLLAKALKRAAPKGPWLQAEIAKAKPAKLDANVATDSEVDEIEKQVKKRSIDNWPLLRRLINRLRRAER